MNEEIEYAEMLEIPVSTVNVVRKKRAKKRSAETRERKSDPADLKESVIAHVNDKLFDEPTKEERITAEAALFAESANSRGEVSFDDIPDRIDTVRLYAEGETPFGESDTLLHPQDYAFLDENSPNDRGRYEMNEEKGRERGWKIALNAEFTFWRSSELIRQGPAYSKVISSFSREQVCKVQMRKTIKAKAIPIVIHL